jgi:hypothetical protein
MDEGFASGFRSDQMVMGASPSRFLRFAKIAGLKFPIHYLVREIVRAQVAPVLQLQQRQETQLPL